MAHFIPLVLYYYVSTSIICVNSLQKLIFFLKYPRNIRECLCDVMFYFLNLASSFIRSFFDVIQCTVEVLIVSINKRSRFCLYRIQSTIKLRYKNRSRTEICWMCWFSSIQTINIEPLLKKVNSAFKLKSISRHCSAFYMARYSRSNWNL